MNKKQRNKNRANANSLASNAHTCSNCGEKGFHYVQVQGWSLQSMIDGVDDSDGFWTCARYYGEDGRRIQE